jgi:hypothetical protein
VSRASFPLLLVCFSPPLIVLLSYRGNLRHGHCRAQLQQTASRTCSCQASRCVPCIPGRRLSPVLHRASSSSSSGAAALQGHLAVLLPSRMSSSPRHIRASLQDHGRRHAAAIPDNAKACFRSTSTASARLLVCPGVPSPTRRLSSVSRLCLSIRFSFIRNNIVSIPT